MLKGQIFHRNRKPFWKYFKHLQTLTKYCIITIQDTDLWPHPVANMFQMALLLLKENCAKLFWNPCINVEVMARTTSIYDHFISWPSSVTLTFNLSEEMIKMALLLLEEKNCAKLFWNPCINLEVVARKSSIYDYYIIWPSSVTLIFNLP